MLHCSIWLIKLVVGPTLHIEISLVTLNLFFKQKVLIDGELSPPPPRHYPSFLLSPHIRHRMHVKRLHLVTVYQFIWFMLKWLRIIGALTSYHTYGMMMNRACGAWRRIFICYVLPENTHTIQWNYYMQTTTYSTLPCFFCLYLGIMFWRCGPKQAFAMLY
jgi:hypothetical protein